ncbi:MAG TPA: NUDIX hydrolase [Patescibacteria group bacterium]|nr:NUDIX hydrolase [Patescibacteria group bacterium]
MQNFNGQYAGILLETKNKEIILQQRDTNPSVINSGKITTFGGSVKSTETPRQAAARELQEELSLKIDPKEFVDFGVYTKDKDTHGQDRICNISLLRNISTDKLIVNEGIGFVLVSEQTKLETLNLSVLTKEILHDYFKK